MSMIATSEARSLAWWIRSVLMLGRPRTCAPGMICYALGYHYLDLPASPRFVLGVVLSFLIGFSANLHNVVSDLDEDAHNLPGRVERVHAVGLPGLRRLLWGLSVVMLIGAGCISNWLLLGMVGAVIGLHQYSFPPVRAKGSSVLGLLVFAQAVGFPFIFGLGTVPERSVPIFADTIVAPLLGFELPNAWVALAANPYIGMYVFLLAWFVAKGLFKNVPDWAGDRAAKLTTSATIFATREHAARFAAWATIGAYPILIGPVMFQLEPPRVLWALVWLVPVAWNARRLIVATDTHAANRVLAFDMAISSGFIGMVLLLVAPSLANAMVVAAALAMIVVSDLLELDSRRDADVGARIGVPS